MYHFQGLEDVNPPKFLHNPKSKLWLFVRPSKMYMEIKMAYNSQNKSETEQT